MRRLALLLAAGAGLLPAQDSRRADLLRRHDEGALGDAELLACVGDEDETLARTALGILLHERAPLPDLRRHESNREAVERLVAGLIERPRGEAEPWLLALLEDPALSPRRRLRILAALPPDRVTDAHARWLFARESAEFRDDVLRLAHRLRPAIAEALIPDLVRCLEAGERAADLLLHIERIGPEGEAALATALPGLDPLAAEAVAGWLAARKSPAVARLVASALAGPDPIPAWALRRIRPEQLDSDLRRRLIRHVSNGDDVAALAFEALVRCGVTDPVLAEYARMPGDQDERRERIELLITLPGASVPDRLWLELLQDHDRAVAAAAARALMRTPYSEVVEDALLQLAGETDPAAAPATHALLVNGSRAATERMWPSLPLERRRELTGWLRHRGRPWVDEFLRAQVDALRDGGPAGLALRDTMLAVLAQSGDRAARAELLGRLERLDDAGIAQASRALIPDLQPDELPAVVAAVEAGSAHRAELLRLLGALPAAAPVELLQRLWHDDEDPEVRHEAIVVLARGPGRRKLCEELGARFAERFGDEERELAFAWAGGLQPPLQGPELALLARLFVLPQSEVAATPPGEGVWYGRDASALAVVIVELLARDPDAELRPFATELATAAGRLTAERQREWSALLLAAARHEALRIRLGWPLARAIAAAGPVPPSAVGPIELLGAEAAEAAGDDAAAARAYRAALRAFWQADPPAAITEPFTGVHDPAAGQVPLARIAVLAELAAARAAADPAVAAAALQRARAFADGDREGMQRVDDHERRW